jgi:hypothetical protein
VTEVVYTSEFGAWWDGLSEDQQDDVDRCVHLLEALGVTLGFPYSSAVKGSNLALRELRVQSGGHPLRILYVFDPRRQAVLLVGGDKAGRDRFYEELIPIAERVYQEYLREIGR